jgi:hypothetical protein
MKMKEAKNLKKWQALKSGKYGIYFRAFEEVNISGNKLLLC